MEKARSGDSRKHPRISVNIECRFKSDEVEDKEYGALMLDVSKAGACFSSTLLPPKIFESDSFLMMVPDDTFSAPEKSKPVVESSPPQEEEIHLNLNQKSKISITFEGDNNESPMTIAGEIRHSSIDVSETGKMANFGIEFESTPQEFLQMLATMSAKPDSD